MHYISNYPFCNVLSLFKCVDEEFAKTTYQNEDFADCGFWDFAGQKEFYATHQTFLSTNAIYLLVVDISKDFASKTHQAMIDNKFDKVGGNYISFQRFSCRVM